MFDEIFHYPRNKCANWYPDRNRNSRIYVLVELATGCFRVADIKPAGFYSCEIQKTIDAVLFPESIDDSIREKIYFQSEGDL